MKWRERNISILNYKKLYLFRHIYKQNMKYSWKITKIKTKNILFKKRIW